MLLYHGSELKITNPTYKTGKPYNDYGLGFYCTKHVELAKEWACDFTHDGYANAYELDTSDLKILYLNQAPYTILHWLTLLLEHRFFRLTHQIAKEAKEYLINNFHIDLENYDVVIGYRADDSYFAFADNFLNNSISLTTLSKAMKLGDLGEQVVLISEKAFSKLTYIESIKANRETYYALRQKRDQKARNSYLQKERTAKHSSHDIYMIDILRKEMKSNDPRLQ